MNNICLSYDVVNLDVNCDAASLHQAMRSIVYMLLFVACWFAAAGAFRSSLLFPLLDGVPS